MVGGFLNLLKPPGMTSHDVVSFVRRVYGVKRVGHAGTLDPAAAGVLPVAVGRATRLIEFITDTDKSYRVELTFGYATDTGDDTGKIIATSDEKMPSATQIEAVLLSFVGVIQQIPPMHSAIKIAGKKLYELARAGITVERPAREIEISSIKLLEVSQTSILFDVVCSKGTYIRSLCRDIGDRLNRLAVMSFLVRTRVGHFSLSESLTMEEVAQKPHLLSPEIFLPLPKIKLSAEESQAFQNGRSISTVEGQGQNVMSVFNEQNMLIGIGHIQTGNSLLVPDKVLL